MFCRTMFRVFVRHFVIKFAIEILCRSHRTQVRIAVSYSIRRDHFKAERNKKTNVIECYYRTASASPLSIHPSASPRIPTPTRIWHHHLVSAVSFPTACVIPVPRSWSPYLADSYWKNPGYFFDFAFAIALFASYSYINRSMDCNIH